jgi:hypothetical protein
MALLEVQDIDQDFWVGKAVDPLLRQGICMALCYEWARQFLASQDCDLGTIMYQDGPEWQRRLSFQRAYDYTWYDQGRQKNYPGFFATLAAGTQKFLTQNGPRDRMNIREVQRSHNRMLIQQAIQAVPLGKAYLIMISGDGNPSEATGIWEHVVAVANPKGVGARLHYFDPNQGLYKVTNDSALGQDVMQDLAQFYEGTAHLNIRHFVLYECS